MYYQIEEMDGYYRIGSPEAVYCYVLVGTERAMLIDTGYAFGDLQGAVRSVTDKPLVIVNTHGHCDHTGGNGQFTETCFIHEADMELCRQHNSPEMRRENASRCMHSVDYETGKEFNALPETFSLDGYCAGGCGKLQKTREGDVFDLGNITAEILETPGHTAGGISVWYREKNLVFLGDAAGFFVWLFLPESTGKASYLHTLDKLYRLGADGYIGGHCPEVMKREELLLYKKAAEEADYKNGEPFQSFLQSDSEPRVCPLSGMSIQEMFQPGFASVVIGKDWGMPENGIQKRPEDREQKIRSLLSQMTLEEKAGQLRQCGPSLVGAFEVSFEELLDMMFDGRISQEEFGRLMSTAKQDFREEDLRAGKIGSYNGIGDAATANRLQKIAVEETRLGIPLLFGYDVIHGFRTVTPIPLAESCAWDPKLWEETARMAAEEATAAGVHMTFAPMVDAAKDARWGRVSEGAGEDVLLNGIYGAAKVKGFQGEDLTREDAMAACVKHFAAYGAAEGGRDYNRVDMSMQRLWEEYLPAYKRCIDAGARAVMPAFNDINGLPCSVNPWLLTEVLRNRWGFNGMTVSDANAIAECVPHGIAPDKRTAAKKALEAGMDMDMTSDCYHEYAADLVKEGEVDEEALDRAVADVLRLKLELGLFEHPYQTNETREKQAFLKPEYRALARKAAAESMVLLKNKQDVLPLKPGTRLGIFGSLAFDKGEMTGAWAIGADPADCISITEACEQRKIPYRYSQTGEHMLSIASESDVLICALGEKKEESGEAASRSDITLPGEQIKLLSDLLATGKPVVVVLFNGRPLAIPFVAEKADAILEAWHPGVEAGNAILDLLLGEKIPGGKLTTTFPYTTGQCPMYYAHINTGRPGGKSKFTSKYLDTPLEPVYPFGYGLSYTTYRYSDLKAEKTKDGFRVSVQVENTGKRAGAEIVQCYARIPTAKRVRPVRDLKAFEKIWLEPGERKEVVFTLSREELGYYDWDMNFVTEESGYWFYTGGNSRDTLEIYI